MNKCSVEIKLKPNSKKNQITFSDAGTLEISVTSPPVENKANLHLVKFLAEKLDLPKSSLQILKGEHSRNKVIAVNGLTIDELKRRLHQ